MATLLKLLNKHSNFARFKYFADYVRHQKARVGACTFSLI